MRQIWASVRPLRAFFFALVATSVQLYAASSPCSEFSSRYYDDMRDLQLPDAVIEAASFHVKVECQQSTVAPQYMTRCYSMLYRWCSGGIAANASVLRCGADWRSVAGLHRIDSVHALLQHARRYQLRAMHATVSGGPTRALIYRPSARGEGWGNRVMALTAAYAAAVLSRRSFHMLFARDDPILSSIDFEQFPPDSLLHTPSAQRKFPCLSFAATLEDPPLNFLPPQKRRQGSRVSWLRALVVPGLDDHVAWLGRADDPGPAHTRCASSSVLYVSGAPAMHHARDGSLRFADGDHGGVWGSASIVLYSSYDSFWGALLERPATGLLLKKLLLPLTMSAAADICWMPARAHLRAWIAFGGFASAVIAPSEAVASVEVRGWPPPPGAARASPHCSRVQCAQCLGVAVRRGRPWNSDYVIVDDAGEARMLSCARAWLLNATAHTSAAAKHDACAFVSADDTEVLQRWVSALTRDGARVARTPGSDGSHTGTQHAARAGTPSARSVHRSYKDWFALACCSRDALLTDNSSFGYSAVALAAQRWLRDGTAALHDVLPLMQQPPPATTCARKLWKGHVCPAPPPLKAGMIPC